MVRVNAVVPLVVLAGVLRAKILRAISLLGIRRAIIFKGVVEYKFKPPLNFFSGGMKDEF